MDKPGGRGSLDGPPIAHAPARRRVAIAIFEDSSSIRRAIGGLKRIGLDAGDMMIVVDPAKCGAGFAAMIAPGSADAGLPAIALRETIRREVAAVAEPATSTPLARFEEWAPLQLGRELDRHLSGGHAVLTVCIHTLEREPKVCGLLLKHSADAVQVHDLVLPH